MTAIDRLEINSAATRIERMPFSSWHLRLLAILGSAHLLDAFDAAALSFVLPVLVGLWHLKPVDAGYLIASGYFGQLVGAVFMGMCAGRFGRINTLQLSLAILALLSLGCALAPSYAILLCLRVVQGIGLGGEVPVAATYMSEVCPSRFRGKMVVALQMLFACGLFVAAFTAFKLIPAFGWRSMFAVGILPLLLAASLRYLLPESPLWLAEKGKLVAANVALAQIENAVYRGNGPAKLQVVENQIVTNTDGGYVARGEFSELVAPNMLKRTLSAWVVGFCVSTTGYGIIGWMPTLYRTVYHLPMKIVLGYSVATTSLSLVGVMSAIVLIDVLGRKPAIILGFFGCAVALGVLVVTSIAIKPIFVMLLISVAVAFLALPLSGIYVYANELYPPRIRALGMGVTSGWVRMASIIGPSVIGFILSYGTVHDVYGFLGGAAVLGGLCMLIFGRETKSSSA